MSKWVETVEEVTASVILWRRQRKFIKKQKQKAKHPVRDWIEAFLWAALVVLLINQYLIQAYKIPSGSMRNTLLEGDRIFVNKFIYGPELLPGTGKLPSIHKPEHSQVIIFENPTYLSKGTLFDIVQRAIYMVTLSLVDIDKDKYGDPRPHFLIKRAVGVGDNRLRFSEGEVEFLLPDSAEWTREKEIPRHNAADYTIRRMIHPDEYDFIRLSGIAEAYESARIPLTAEMRELVLGTDQLAPDSLEWNKYRYRTLYTLYPNDRKYAQEWNKLESGWYIPPGWIFPLGDNRDNSRDARFFGPVNTKDVLGKAMFIYLPLDRIGGIN